MTFCYPHLPKTEITGVSFPSNCLFFFFFPFWESHRYVLVVIPTPPRPASHSCFLRQGLNVAQASPGSICVWVWVWVWILRLEVDCVFLCLNAWDKLSLSLEMIEWLYWLANTPGIFFPLSPSTSPRLCCFQAHGAAMPELSSNATAGAEMTGSPWWCAWFSFFFFSLLSLLSVKLLLKCSCRP